MSKVNAALPIFMRVFILALLIFSVVLPLSAFADGKSDLAAANAYIERAVQAAQDGETGDVEAQFKQFTEQWYDIEDGVKRVSPAAYRDIEQAMGRIQLALVQQSGYGALVESLENLQAINRKFIDGGYPQEAPVGNMQSKATVEELVVLLNQSLDALSREDAASAAKNMEQFQKKWIDVEGIVLTRSPRAYSDTERDMVLSYAYLTSNPPDIKAAKTVLGSMRSYLQPLSGKTEYSLLDATTILLREGLEALLVVVAMLGFLKKTGNSQKKNWVWLGVGSGALFSIALGFLVTWFFSSGAFGSNNFLIAGWTGIFAAAMLLYMSYWLHSKSNMVAWQHYIRSRGTKALAAGSLWSLAVLSFLAVFREGTETVLFFIGMASSIRIATLLAGIGLGIAILLILSILILKVGLKIPMRPFFIVSSLLVFYLSFKFTGMGIHGLQMAGVLPVTIVPGMSSFEALAVYPTSEGIIPQALLIVIALGIVLWNKYRAVKLRKTIGLKQT